MTLCQFCILDNTMNTHYEYTLWDSTMRHVFPGTLSCLSLLLSHICSLLFCNCSRLICLLLFLPLLLSLFLISSLVSCLSHVACPFLGCVLFIGASLSRCPCTMSTNISFALSMFFFIQSSLSSLSPLDFCKTCFYQSLSYPFCTLSDGWKSCSWFWYLTLSSCGLLLLSLDSCILLFFAGYLSRYGLLVNLCVQPKFLSFPPLIVGNPKSLSLSLYSPPCHCACIQDPSTSIGPDSCHLLLCSHFLLPSLSIGSASASISSSSSPLILYHCLYIPPMTIFFIPLFCSLTQID